MALQKVLGGQSVVGLTLAEDKLGTSGSGCEKWPFEEMTRLDWEVHSSWMKKHEILMYRSIVRLLVGLKSAIFATEKKPVRHFCLHHTIVFNCRHFSALIGTDGLKKESRRMMGKGNNCIYHQENWLRDNIWPYCKNGFLISPACWDDSWLIRVLKYAGKNCFLEHMHGKYIFSHHSIISVFSVLNR